ARRVRRAAAHGPSGLTGGNRRAGCLSGLGCGTIHHRPGHRDRWRADTLIVAGTGGSVMKLLRYGPAGAERPAMLDKDGAIRCLAGVVRDIDGFALSPASLKMLASIDPM